jgi:uncharacterized protein YbjQ (UPF0145 family)
VLIVTMNDIPGFEVTHVLGEVMGLTVRSRNVFSQFGAAFKSLAGGELRGMTKALYDSRNEVMQRLVGEAQARGGNAIIAMRFDTSEMGDVWTEICVYGTAVWVEPVTDAARAQAAQIGMVSQGYPPPPPGYGPPQGGYPSGGVPGQPAPGQGSPGQPLYPPPGG